MLSSIYSATFSFGQFLGPVYGGYFKEILGYRNWCDLAALILIVYSIIYYALISYFTKPIVKEMENLDEKSKKTNISTTFEG